MYKELFQQHERHFCQAEHTPFATQLLKELIILIAEGPLACQLKYRIAEIENILVDNYTKDILQELQWKETDQPK
eukprot:540246-Ditylum_brightwellii.AAC.1